MGTFDGPGLRLVVFLQGCNFRCLYCANPDTIAGKGGTPTPPEEIIRMAMSQCPFFGKRGGITFSGGEPTFQAKALVPLVRELKEKGISDEAIAKLQPIILLSGTNAEKLNKLRKILRDSEIGLQGVEEIDFIRKTLWNDVPRLKNKMEIDLTLARGLNYYTGAIFEVKALDVQIGSITGGGRYDNLTGVFGLENVSGVGISFGADRIFDVLNQLELYPKEATDGTKVLFLNLGEKESKISMYILNKVRNAGIHAEIFPDIARKNKQQNKQMSYAKAKNVPFVAIVEEKEMNNKKNIRLKNMKTGKYKFVSAEELIAVVKK